MNKMKLNRKTPFYSLIILLLFVTHTLFANEVVDDSAWAEYTKKYEETFSFNTNSPDILISNKYGEVNIVSSDLNEAKFEVVITVEAKSEKRANEIFSKINVDLSGDNSSASGITDFDSKRGWSWSKKNEKYQIDYLVHLPKRAELEIRNSYGAVIITDHLGAVDLKLKYGNGILHNVGGDMSITLGYADKFTLGNVGGTLELNCSYSHFEMGDVSEIDGTTKYSDIYIGNVGNIDVETKYDHFNVQRVSELDLQGKYYRFNAGTVGHADVAQSYSKLKIDQLNGSGEFSTKYGSVRIDEVGSEANSVIIDSQYTDYDLHIPGGVNLDIDTKYTTVRYPEALEIAYRDRDSNELKLRGSSGSGRVQVNATMKYGKLKITD